VIVKIPNDYRLFVVKYQIQDTLFLTTFFATYSPIGESVFETYVVPADCVIPYQPGSVALESTADYDFQVGDRVRYVGDAPVILSSLQGKDLTVEAIGARDIGCIRDGETHLRFLRPSLLERIEPDSDEYEYTF
jgi:hypothetical protein